MKPRIKKYGCMWVVLTLQTSGTWKGFWTFEAQHHTLEKALIFAKHRYFSK